MEDKLLDTPEKVETAIANFIDLQQHPGWILLTEMVKVNIDVLTEQILAGGDEALMNEKRRDLLAYKNVINTPQDQINKFRTPDSPVPSFDPYEKAKKLDKDIE